MKIWLVALLLLILSGCANTDHYRAVLDCRALNPAEGACAVEWAAYQQAEDRKARKEAEEAAMACPSGTSRWCDHFCSRSKGIGSCVRNHDIRDALGEYGF